jgi:hypothetical protein
MSIYQPELSAASSSSSTTSGGNDIPTKSHRDHSSSPIGVEFLLDNNVEEKARKSTWRSPPSFLDFLDGEAFAPPRRVYSFDEWMEPDPTIPNANKPSLLHIIDDFDDIKSPWALNTDPIESILPSILALPTLDDAAAKLVLEDEEEEEDEPQDVNRLLPRALMDEFLLSPPSSPPNPAYSTSADLGRSNSSKNRQSSPIGMIITVDHSMQLKDEMTPPSSDASFDTMSTSSSPRRGGMTGRFARLVLAATASSKNNNNNCLSPSRHLRRRRRQAEI